MRTHQIWGVFEGYGRGSWPRTPSGGLKGCCGCERAVRDSNREGRLWPCWGAWLPWLRAVCPLLPSVHLYVYIARGMRQEQ